MLLLLSLTLMSSAGATEPNGCHRESFEHNAYIVCDFDPATGDLRLFWRDAHGEPYRQFDRLADEIQARGDTLQFALNAGMYTTDFVPVGLYIENGETLRRLNTRTIDAAPARVPNFYKQPNGVFYLEHDHAGILTTAAYAEAGRSPRFATQSGPMLVIDNTLHPALIEGSTSVTRRSGVGVCRNGEVQFAISESLVNFHDFARLFRDQLKCPNALFLDGGRGAGIYSPALNRYDASWHGGYGPMFGVVASGSAEPSLTEKP
nr:phosphodiester glycosidase family protein [Salinisphaera sp.]